MISFTSYIYAKCSLLWSNCSPSDHICVQSIQFNFPSDLYYIIFLCNMFPIVWTNCSPSGHIGVQSIQFNSSSDLYYILYVYKMFPFYEQIVRQVAISVSGVSYLILIVTSVTSYIYATCSHFMHKLFAKWPYRCSEHQIYCKTCVCVGYTKISYVCTFGCFRTLSYWQIIRNISHYFSPLNRSFGLEDI